MSDQAIAALDPATLSDAELSAVTLVRVCSWRWASFSDTDDRFLLLPPLHPGKWFFTGEGSMPERAHRYEAWATYLSPVATDVGAFFAEVVPAMGRAGWYWEVSGPGEGELDCLVHFWRDGWDGEYAAHPQIARAGCVAALAALSASPAPAGDGRGT